MKIIPLTFETAALTGFTHKVIITYADLVAAAGASDTTVTLQIFPDGTTTAAAGTLVSRVAYVMPTGFDASDAAINSLLMEVGDGGSTARFMAQKQLAEDGSEVHYWATANVTDTLPYVYPSADGIDAKFTVAGGGDPTIDELTAGEVHLYLHIVNLEDLTAIE